MRDLLIGAVLVIVCSVGLMLLIDYPFTVGLLCQLFAC